MIVSLRYGGSTPRLEEPITPLTPITPSQVFTCDCETDEDLCPN